MKSKWFKFDGQEFGSKREAKTEKSAWAKTLEKAGWISEGFETYNQNETCGLCNYYSCLVCPLYYFSETDGKYGIRLFGHDTCVPYKKEPDLQYLWLLFVYQAVMSEEG